MGAGEQRDELRGLVLHDEVWLAPEDRPAAPLLVTTMPCGANRVARASMPRASSCEQSMLPRGLVAAHAQRDGRWSVVEGAHASVRANPMRSSQRSTSHCGCDSVMLRYAARRLMAGGSVGRSGRADRPRPREMARSTALTNPLALRLPARLVSATASSTTAEAGTRVRCSSW